MEYLTLTIKDSFHWILSGLRWPLSEKFQQAIFPEAPNVIIRISDENYAFSIPESLKSNKKFTKLPTQGLLTNLAELLSSLSTFNSIKIILIIPSNDVLIKNLSIPKGATKNLGSIVRFELERVTPFNLEQIYYDYFVSNKNSNDANILITACLVSAKKYQDLMALSKKHKALISFEDEKNSVLAINLSATKKNYVQPDFLLPFKFKLFLLFFISLLVLLFIPQIKYDALIQELEIEIADNRSEALSLREGMLSFSNQNDRGAFLLNYRNNYFSPLNLLKDLSQTLPEHTWLRTLSTSVQFTQIQGESPSAAETLALIENSPYLENAEFSSPVTNVTGSDKEEFHIIATSKAIYEQ
ncbi:MAG: hypothetical protein COA71_12700 [SAR86 cluster bacterium]|uniref:GspL cytoplasmic actin-ATPase-like domain-containing protein n=1 Tax=SAR86 cluster bacterium TaxID=2030880 RepID=A0A2A5C974_9GAMM|nr:MAG: hypothetical protein COA71_12700 [SAR86 cluster bacterium]